MCVERGGYLFLDAIGVILRKYNFASVLLVGFIHDREIKCRLMKLMRLFPGRIKHLLLNPGEMPAVYREADITVIPTLYSEGTSLSCLEAMASGNAVIATFIGGLPNLIIDEYNGLLISPEVGDLVDSISRLLEDETLRGCAVAFPAIPVSRSETTGRIF